MKSSIAESVETCLQLAERAEVNRAGMGAPVPRSADV